MVTLVGNPPWSALADVAGAAVTRYRHEGLRPGVTRHYRVKATSDSGDSPWSNVASATTTRGHRPVVEDWLARFGRTAAGATLDAIARRVDAAAAATDAAEASLTLGGHRVALGAARPGWRGAGGTEPWNEAAVHAPTLQNLANDSSFDLPSSSTGGVLNVWGAGGYHRFRMAPRGEYRMHGGVLSGTLGVDHAADDHVVGLALAYHGGTGTFGGNGTGPEAKGELESHLISVHPYGRIAFGDLFHVGGSLGLGAGTLSIEDAAIVTTGIRMRAAAALDARVELSLTDRWILAVRTDGRLVNMTADAAGVVPGVETVTSRLRLGLETSYAVSVAAGLSVAPTLKAGLRYDLGDAETGFGLDLGGDLRVEAPGIDLTVDGRGHAVLDNWSGQAGSAAGLPGVRDWGFGGVIRWQPDFGGHGPEIALAPSYAATAGEPAPGGASPRMAAEVGYRVAVPGGTLNPYGTVEISGDGQRRYRAGARLEVGDPARSAIRLVMRAGGVHDQPATGAAKQSLMLEMRLLQ